LIDPAVKGTLNVLGSCKKAASVKRVILTSSMAAVVFTENPLSPDVVVDETSFSIPELCEKAKVLYRMYICYYFLKHLRPKFSFKYFFLLYMEIVIMCLFLKEK